MNNDRFKFRVWDKGNNEYLNEKNIMNISNDGDIECYAPEYDAATDEIFDTLLNNERLVIEQCTGLRDKNGNLIYEGDIVRYTSRGLEFEGVVVWWTGVPYVDEDFGGWCIEITKNKEWENMDYSRDWETFEVIGNIHEVKNG